MSSSLFVVEADPVVALDIAETLQGHHPGDAVHVFDTIAEAESALTMLARPTLLVVSLTRGQSVASVAPELGDRLRRVSDHVVVICDNAPNGDLDSWGVSVVTRPFTSGMLIAAVISSGCGAQC